MCLQLGLRLRLGFRLSLNIVFNLGLELVIWFLYEYGYGTIAFRACVVQLILCDRLICKLISLLMRQSFQLSLSLPWIIDCRVAQMLYYNVSSPPSYSFFSLPMIPITYLCLSLSFSLLFEITLLFLSPFLFCQYLRCLSFILCAFDCTLNRRVGSCAYLAALD